MRLPMPPPRNDPFGKYLCHRGVNRAVVREIAEVFREDDPRLIVQKGDALSLSFGEFRRAAIDRLQIDCHELIVLLSRNFPGPAYQQTFGGNFEKWALGDPRRRVHIIAIRVDDCEIGNADLSADLAEATNRSARRELIAGSLGRRWVGIVDCFAVSIRAMGRDVS